MKTTKKSKDNTKPKADGLPPGMQKTHEVSKSRIPKEEKTNVFTPMETGQPDQDRLPGWDNPAAAQGGLGPTNQEGEGELQNDQLAALEEIEPEG
jgi:hypothetical protein